MLVDDHSVHTTDVGMMEEYGESGFASGTIFLWELV